MSHSVYFDVECKLVFHSLRGIGPHFSRGHKTDYYAAIQSGILRVLEAECWANKYNSFSRCELSGVPLDKLDRFIRDRYLRILEEKKDEHQRAD